MKKICFIANPFAGAGGRLGWKGTDWPLPLKLKDKDPRSLPAYQRAERFLEKLLALKIERVDLLVAPCFMGQTIFENVKRKLGIDTESTVLDCSSCRWPTTPDDTRACLRQCLETSVDLLVFLGGDGTARLVYDVVNGKVPVIGVPGGVKVYSGVFAESPEAAAELVKAFINDQVVFEERPVLDIDEEMFRRNQLQVKTYGYLTVPVHGDIVVSGKTVYVSSVQSEIAEIAEYFKEEIYRDCTLYIMGPGSTTARIASVLGVEKTLLGVDVVHNKKIIAKDVNEEKLIEILHRYKSNKKMIIVSPIGGQGFVFGRGNQQISPRIIKEVGRENILVVSAPSKLKHLKKLRVDTGDPELDRELRGYIRVLIGYGKYKIMKLA